MYVIQKIGHKTSNINDIIFKTTNCALFHLEIKKLNNVEKYHKTITLQNPKSKRCQVNSKFKHAFIFKITENTDLLIIKIKNYVQARALLSINQRTQSCTY